MATLIIKKHDRELEVHPIGEKKLITVEIVNNPKGNYEYALIDLTQEEARKVINFLRAQLE